MALATDNRTETDPAVIAARLRSVEAHLASAPVHELDNLADDVGRVQSWLAAYLAKLTARADAARPQGGDARRTAARTGIGSREAAKAAKRGEAMARMPEAMNALEDGEIGVGHADAMAAQSDRLSGDQRRAFEDQAAGMVRHAVENGESVHAFGLRCRELADRLLAEEGIRQEHERRRRASKASSWVDPVDGMTKLYGHWDPVRGEAIRRALDAEVAARTAAGAKVGTHHQREQLAAEALHALICGERVSASPGGPVVAVHVDLEAVVTGLRHTAEGETLTAEMTNGQSVPVETIRRIACEAGILPIVLDGKGQALDVGRERRLATKAQRLALRAMYPTCGMDPDCDVPFDRCEIHHVDLWGHGGRTDLARMIPGCDQHHHLVHEGGWTLTRGPDGTWQLHPPRRPPP